MWLRRRLDGRQSVECGFRGTRGSTAGNFESALSALVGPKIGVHVVSDHAFFIANASVIATVAAGHHLPSIGCKRRADRLRRELS